MAWWGVAMAWHRPYFPDSDDEAGRRALASYTRFLGVWNNADKDLAEFREARDYVQANQG